MRVGIVDTGVANLASIRAALARLGVEWSSVRSPADTPGVTHLVLPGVGAFGSAVRALRDRGLDVVITEAVASGVPVLGICLGMQVLFDGSDESLGTEGLGVFPGTCRRLPDHVRVPHLGWNRIETDRAGITTPGYAAFANSYVVTEPPPADAIVWCRHGVRFVAAVERGRLLACQFHPELSGTWGMQLLRRWLKRDRLRLVTERTGMDGPVRRLIPCLDICDGRVVKGVQFQGLRDAGDPVERAAMYEAQGADELVILDVAATPRGRATQMRVVEAVRRVLSIPLTVGGGVRTAHDVRQLLAAGADKVSVNTAALQRPELLTDLAGEFGSQCIVLAVDARRTRDGWDALVRSGDVSSGRDAVQWAADGVERGAGEVLLTSWDRDGTKTGCDEELLRAVTSRVTVPVVASGGIGTPADVVRALAAGADAVLAATIFHDDELTVQMLKRELAGRGIPIRP